jgi:hypothetical protein
MNAMKRPCFPGALALLWLALGAACAQAQINELPNWTTTIQTTGGITYFKYDATVGYCKEIQLSPLTTSDTNLLFRAGEFRYSGYCAFCFECEQETHSEAGVAVLGNLATGSYLLRIASWYLEEWSSLSFQVPPNSGSTLTVTAEADKTRIAVNGVQAAIYVLETSTNLLDWTSVRTNQGAPCTFTNSASMSPSQFFRVQVKSGRKI